MKPANKKSLSVAEAEQLLVAAHTLMPDKQRDRDIAEKIGPLNRQQNIAGIFAAVFAVASFGSYVYADRSAGAEYREAVEEMGGYSQMEKDCKDSTATEADADICYDARIEVLNTARDDRLFPYQLASVISSGFALAAFAGIFILQRRKNKLTDEIMNTHQPRIVDKSMKIVRHAGDLNALEPKGPLN